MKTKKTTVISHETHEELTVRVYRAEQPQKLFGWCDQCASASPLLTPEEAPPLSGLSVRDVYRLVEAGAIHFQEAEGRVFVCVESIATRGVGTRIQPLNVKDKEN
jgi:hypothetical protein